MRPRAYLTAPSPAFPPRQEPAAALRALAALLCVAGITHLYGSACARYGVLSVSGGLTVWTNGRVLWWRVGGEQATWPAADPDGAARQLTAHAVGLEPLRFLRLAPERC